MKSRTEFPSDTEYQVAAKSLMKQLGLDDDQKYLVSLDTGFVQHKGKMELTPQKLSKSSAPIV